MVQGDANWEAANGHIDLVERFRYVAAALRVRLRLLLRGATRQNVDLVRDLGALDLDRIVRPDSRLARSTEDLLRAFGSPVLVEHSLRTYLWGSLLGQLDDQKYDAEVLYVASLLHDLGLTAALHGSSPGAACFTLDGVRGAEPVLAQTTPERAERIRRAVTLHLNIEVPGELHGWEAHYVRAGALLDVTGERYHELPAELVHRVLELHPRQDLKEEVIRWARSEARIHAGSRLATLSLLGIATLVRRAPFET